MSDYIEEAAKVIIKEEYREEFQHIADGKYLEIQDKKLRDLLKNYYEAEQDEYSIEDEDYLDKNPLGPFPFKVWRNFVGYANWEINSPDVEHKNEYADGIFTFSVGYNLRNNHHYYFRQFLRTFLHDILTIVVESVIYHELYAENDIGEDGPFSWRKEKHLGWKNYMKKAAQKDGE